MSAAETADHLSQEIGGKSSHWSIWLANDRKPGRVNRRLPQVPGPGRPRYNADIVDAFVSEFKRNQLQSGQADKRSSSVRERRLMPHISTISLAEGADQGAVLFVIPKPLVSFMLTPDEARQIASRLTKAADEIDVEVKPMIGGVGSEQVTQTGASIPL